VIGRAKPISVTIDTLATATTTLSDELLSEKIQAQFPLTPAWITNHFGLDKPSKETFLYADVAARGQVGYDEYPWEQLDALSWFQTLNA